MSVLRLIWAGWKFHVKSLTLSGFFLLTFELLALAPYFRR